MSRLEFDALCDKIVYWMGLELEIEDIEIEDIQNEDYDLDEDEISVKYLEICEKVQSFFSPIVKVFNFFKILR